MAIIFLKIIFTGLRPLRFCRSAEIAGPQDAFGRLDRQLIMGGVVPQDVVPEE